MIYILIYVVIGVFWSLFRWWSHVASVAKEHRKVRAAWLKSNEQAYAAVDPVKSKMFRDITGTPDLMVKNAWREYVNLHCEIQRPIVNSEFIRWWVIFWPLSMLSYPFVWVKCLVIDCYQKIADRGFKGLE